MNPLNPLSSDEPIIDPKTLLFKRAIKDEEQGFIVCEQLLKDNDKRNKDNAAIQRKLDGEQPWEQSKLAAAGQGWRNNRATGFMESLVNRMQPPYKQLVDSAKSLTHSKLTADTPEAQDRTDTFRNEITRTIREWEGWDDLTSRVIAENLTFGYASTAQTDEYDWHPIMARGDEAFFPNGCPQLAADVPVWMLKQSWLLHKAAEYLEDPQAAKAAGWRIDEFVEAINEACPDDPGRSQTTNLEDARRIQDNVREKTLGLTYMTEVKVVPVYQLFAQEANGKVTQKIYSVKTKKEIFSRLDRYDSMSDCLSLYSAEIGNGKLQGSKGVGRKLYNTHVAVEQSRNLFGDAMALRGGFVLRRTEKNANITQLAVVNQFVIIPEGFEYVDAKWQIDAESFQAHDQFMTSIAEVQVGAFLPSRDLSADTQKTASEVNYLASIQQQIQQGHLRRFWGQLQRMVYSMQKRICRPENVKEARRIILTERKTALGVMSAKLFDFLKRLGDNMRGKKREEPNGGSDKAAVDCLVRMMRKNLTVEQIFELSDSPSYQVSDEEGIGKELTAAIESVVTRYLNDPMVDQIELRRRDIASKLGNTSADKLLLDNGEDNATKKGVHDQLIELTSLMQGEPIPVLQSDDDVIHMQTTMDKVSDLFDKIAASEQGPGVALAQNVMAHFDGHLNNAIAKGTPKETLKKFQDFSSKIKTVLTSIDSQLQQGAMPSTLPPGTVPGLKLPGDMASGPDQLSETAQINDQQLANPQPVPPSEGMPLSRGPIPVQPRV